VLRQLARHPGFVEADTDRAGTKAARSRIAGIPSSVSVTVVGDTATHRTEAHRRTLRRDRPAAMLARRLLAIWAAEEVKRDKVGADEAAAQDQ
jgi:hypothetical protein